MKKIGQNAEYGNGHFGQWKMDQFNLPAYEYTCMQDIDSIALTKTSGSDSIDQWHQVGNDRITLTAHNGGYMQFFIANRGLQWISYRDRQKNCLGGGICFIEENGKVWSDLYNSKRKRYQRIFGCGYFQKIAEYREISIENFTYPPFGDDSVVLTELLISNNSNRTRKVAIYTYWGLKIKSLVGSILSMLYTTKDRKKFGESKLVSFVLRLVKTLLLGFGLGSEQIHERFGTKFSVESSFLDSKNCMISVSKYKGKIPVRPEQTADRNYYLDPFFLASFERDLPIKWYNQLRICKKGAEYVLKKNLMTEPTVNRCLMLGHELILKPQETKQLVFIFGTARQDQIPGLIEKYEPLIHQNFKTKNFEDWSTNLFSFTVDASPWLSREVSWHSYYLRSALLYDDYFQSHYLPQGNAYTFLHGANGAIRDYVLFLIPIIYQNPDLAREMLEYAFRTMNTIGKLPYALVGYGQQMGAIVHEASSDLHLFLLWGLMEYLFITRDFQFLEKEIPFYPLDCGKSSTVLAKIILSLQFLFQKIGLGEHGMIKVGSGDWSDGVSLLVKNRGAFLKKGESTFNSAFALYIIPPLIKLLDKYTPKFTRYLNQKYEDLKKACLETWNGRWFYRGWDGLGAPVGDRNLFLEHHVWMLLSGVVSQNQANILINNIYKLLDSSSKAGQYILYPPANAFLNVLPHGWDVNGGIWHAMNFLLTWAYSKYDSNKAYNSILKNSMAWRAEAYPNIWYGIWSGPDAFNADYAVNPGQTYINPPTPQTDFPIMNLNLHANFLDSVIKLVGIEFTLDGLIIDPKIPEKAFSFWTPMLALEVKENQMKGFYKPLTEDNCIIRIKRPLDWNQDIEVLLNGQVAMENVIIEGSWVCIKVDIPATGIEFILQPNVP